MVLTSLCVALAFHSATQGKPAVYKGVDYNLPAKWETTESNGVLVVIPDKKVEGQAIAILISSSLPKEGKPWDQVFKSFLAAAEQATTVVSRSETNTSKRGVYDIFVQTQELKSDEMGDYSCLYQMVADAKNAAAVCVIIKGEEILKANQDALSEFLLKVRPHNSVISDPKNPLAKSKIRTGETPDAYVGSKGWLPSGRGTVIPKAAIVDGKPVGMWFTQSTDTQSKPVFYKHIFLADGTAIIFPRFGGGSLVDIEGLKAKQSDAKYVGTFKVANGKMSTDVGGFKNEGAFTTGKDSSGIWFEIGKARYRPCVPVTSDFLVGTWRIPGSAQYTFDKDGSLKFGYLLRGDDFVAGSNGTGNWVLDNYLIAFDKKDDYSVNSIYKFTDDSIIIGQSMYFRVK